MELILRKLYQFEKQGLMTEALVPQRDAEGALRAPGIGDPEQYVITHLGRPGLFHWLGDLDRVVRERDFPDWDEDTLLDVIELYHNVMVCVPTADLDGTASRRAEAQRIFREGINEALSMREPPLRLGSDGKVSTTTPGSLDATAPSDSQAQVKPYDVFISYASEDHDAIAHPLAERLNARGYRVFFDKFVLRPGDHLTTRIDEGLAQTRRGVVILSTAFFEKKWPRYELDSLTTRELASGENLIIPIWHQVDAEQVARYSPALANRLAITSAGGIDAIVAGIERALERRAHEPPSGHLGHSSALVATLRRVPLVGWLYRDQPRIIDLIVIAILGALAAAYFTTHDSPTEGVTGTQPPSSRAVFSGLVDANVVHQARAHKAASQSSGISNQFVAGTKLDFVGFCIGEPTIDLINALPDERWFILPDKSLIASAVINGNPPSQLQPAACPEGRPGPRSIALSARRDGAEQQLLVSAPAAKVVGFAVLEEGARAWRALVLEPETAAGYRAHFTLTRPAVALVAACWAVEAPAHPIAGRYISAQVALGSPSSSFKTHGRETAGAGAKKACSVDAYNAMSKLRPRAVSRGSRGRSTSKPAGSTNVKGSNSPTSNGGSNNDSSPAPEVSTSNTTTGQKGTKVIAPARE